jgi:hypothetical protein
MLLGTAVAIATPAVVSAPAHADDKAVVDARARFNEGLDRAKRHDFEGARLAFVQAYAVIKSPDILYNLALAEEKSAHPLDAIAHFRAYVRDKSLKDSDRDSARKHIDALAKITGHIEVTAPAGWNVFVDGAAAGTTPLFEPIDVASGKHKVEVRTPEKSYAMSVDAPVGEVTKASFVDMIQQQAGTPITPPAPSGSGSASGAGTSAPPPGAAPATSAASTNGAATPAPTGSADTGTTPDAAGGTLWTPRNVTVIALGVGAVAALGVGVGFFMGASSQDDKVTQLKATNPNCAGSTSSGCADLASAADARSSDRNVGTAFVIGGSALAIGAIAAFVFWPKASATTSATQTSGVTTAFVPVIAPGSAGLRWVGHF